MMCHDMMFSCKAHTKLGGGFEHVLFSPYFLCELIQFDVHIFLKWVVQPTNQKTYPKHTCNSGRSPDLERFYHVLV